MCALVESCVLRVLHMSTVRLGTCCISCGENLYTNFGSAWKRSLNDSITHVYKKKTKLKL